MPGIQMTRRYFSWRSRGRSQRVQRSREKVVHSWWEDLTNVNLVPIKITFFFIMGATQCVLPFKSIFMKALGLSVEETAIIYTIVPLIPILAPFLAGLLTDRLENLKIFLVASLAFSGVVSMFNLSVPPARTEISSQQDIKFDLLCTHHFVIRINTKNICKINNGTIKLDKLEVHNCGYLCLNPPIIMEENIRKTMQNISIYNVFNNSLSYRCDIGSSYVQKCYVIESASLTINRRLKTPENYTLWSPVFNLTTTSANQLISTVVHSCRSINERYSGCQPQASMSSYDFPTMSITSVDYNRPPSSLRPNWVSCNFHCVGIMPSKKICHGPIVITHNVLVTFWIFVIITNISAFMIGLTYSMFEACVIKILKENGHDYGFQRIYGSIGGIVFAPLTGYLVDAFGSGSYTDYYICFIMYFILKLICSLLIFKLDLNLQGPTPSTSGSLRKIFSHFETNLLIFIVFISGMCYGFIEHFLPWFLNDLKASDWLIGMMTTISSLAAIPFLAASGKMAKRFGYVQCICFGLVCYSIRCIGYSMIYNPIWCLPFEILEGVTTGLLVATAITYGAKLSSKSNVGTMQGILATFHYGIGKGLGSLTGGFMMSRLSARIAFRVFSGAAIFAAFFYYLILKLYILPKKLLDDRMKADVSAMSVEIITSERPPSKPIEAQKKSFRYSLRIPLSSIMRKPKPEEVQIPKNSTNYNPKTQKQFNNQNKSTVNEDTNRESDSSEENHR